MIKVLNLLFLSTIQENVHLNFYKQSLEMVEHVIEDSRAASELDQAPFPYSKILW
jgi:hypothetical protein